VKNETPAPETPGDTGAGTGGGKRKRKADAFKIKFPRKDAGTKTETSETQDASPESGAETGVPEPLQEQLLRLRADFDNFRRRTLREKNALYQRANEDLMEELLPVLDHLELALAAAAEHKTDDAVTEGFRLVSEQLISALGKFGLERLDAEDGVFDPNIHEAVSHLPSGDVDEGHIMAQTRRGYRLGSRLLRAAQVVVSSGLPSGGTTAQGDDGAVNNGGAPEV
jgi:molecular chaperone GrpE